jgi:hypothetical protein
VRLLHRVRQLGDAATLLDRGPGTPHQALDSVHRFAAAFVAGTAPFAGQGQQRPPVLRRNVGAHAEPGHPELAMQELVCIGVRRLGLAGAAR